MESLPIGRQLLQSTVPLGYDYTVDGNKDVKDATIMGLGPVIVAAVWLILGALLLLGFLCGWRRKLDHSLQKATAHPPRLSSPLKWPLLGLGLLLSIVGIGCAFGANPKLIQAFRSARNDAYAAADDVVYVGQVAGAQLRNSSALIAQTPPQFSALLGGVIPATLPATLNAEADTVVYVTQHASDNMRAYLDPPDKLSQAIYITVYIILGLSILLLLLTLIGLATSSALTLMIALALLWCLAIWTWVWVGAVVAEHNAFEQICHDAQRVLDDQNDQSSELSVLLPCKVLIPGRTTAAGSQQLADNATFAVNRLLPQVGAIGSLSGVNAPVPGPVCAPFPLVAPPSVPKDQVTPANCQPLNQTLPALGQYYSQVVANNPAAQHYRNVPKWIGAVWGWLFGACVGSTSPSGPDILRSSHSTLDWNSRH